MARLHTRQKRKMDITSSRRGRFRNVKGKPGAKTFSTEDKATKYAKDVMKVEKFKVVSAKRGKRFKVNVESE